MINYSYNALGQVDNVNLDQNGVVTTLTLNINYYLFGPESFKFYGNTLNVIAEYDSAYRSYYITTANVYFDYLSAYDRNGNVLSSMAVNAGGTPTQIFKYDEQNRMISSSGYSGTFIYNYDLVGNRTLKSENAVVTDANYQPNSNQLAGLGGEVINVDANGNINNLKGMVFSFTSDNRLKSVVAKARFEYDAQGQRVIKAAIAPGAAGAINFYQSTVYLYGLNGELLAEMGPTGKVKKEYVYLNNQLLAMLDHSPSSNELFLRADIDRDGEVSIEDYRVWFFNHKSDPAFEVTGDGVNDSQDVDVVVNCGLNQGSCVASSFASDIYYVHSDHLGTPKVLTDSAGQLVWRLSLIFASRGSIMILRVGFTITTSGIMILRRGGILRVILLGWLEGLILMLMLVGIL